MGCLACSSFSHLLASHSRPFNFFFWRLDYAGISLMIVCSFFAPIYYAFSCHPYSRLFYLTSISLLGILVIVTLLAPGLSTPRFRTFRASLFLTMGFSGVIPAAHAVALFWGHPPIIVALGYEIVMGILYAVGAGFYITRIPERWKPGAFDIAGHSHQIFHMFVVAGALAHCAATLVIMDWRRAAPTCDVSHELPILMKSMNSVSFFTSEKAAFFRALPLHIHSTLSITYASNNSKKQPFSGTV
ncbi:hypothetical protein F0562_009252 [Nyssa sinensis]|uniref:Uncharacterized protein n=1 Tax=Nyssa sinensis TaxID=561372 RepID=A0A5J4ZXM9_9ASTE|nr:hypothetical protein F0562_009252 [Nyssa sinensis]